jgi:hypothetical protein
MTSVDTPPQKPPRPEGGGSGSGGVRRVNSIVCSLTVDRFFVVILLCKFGFFISFFLDFIFQFNRLLCDCVIVF